MKNYDHRLVGAASDKGTIREENEDAFLVSQQTDPTQLGAIYVVADGVGGQEHGAAASEIAVHVIYDTFYQARERGEAIQPALEWALHQANEAVYNEAQARGGGRMGCTVVAAVQDDGQVYVAHVGDARAYMVHRNHLRRMTRDDTLVQKQVEAGLITPEQAESHELRNVVTQVLGNKLDIQVHLSRPYLLQPYDILLLCSDGLYGAVAEDEIERIMTEQPALAAAEQLIATAVSHQARDNITAVVVRCSEIMGVKRRTRPRWLPWAALALLGIFLLSLLLPRLWARDGETSADAVPTTTAPLVAPQITSSPTTVETTIIRSTATISPTLVTSLPIPTQTAVPTATEVPLACVLYDNTFVWTDEQIDDSQCDSFAAQSLVAGTTVQLLTVEPRTANGPDAACIENQFRKIRTVTEPEIEGWVLANGLGERPETGCQP